MFNEYAAPSRPDWRWATVVQLSTGTDVRAKALLRQTSDSVCVRAYAFKRAKEYNQAIIFEHPDIAAAYDFYMGEVFRRGLLEGYLLTGADDGRISLAFGCHPKVIAVYHDLFFEVRPRLHAHAWISSAVFHELPYTGVHKHDRMGMIHRIAWIGGLEAFEASISPRATITDIHSIYKDVIERALAQNSVEIVLSGAGSPEVSAQFLSTTVDRIKDAGERKAKSENDYEEAVSTFVRGIGITVADPTKSDNLNLPAREPRESEYEVRT